MINGNRLFTFEYFPAVLFILSLLFFPGCMGGLNKQAGEMHFYTIETDRSREKPPSRRTLNSLFVMDFTASPPDGGSMFVYKSGKKILTDYYNRFAVPPPGLVKAACIRWLKQAALFENVTGDLEMRPFKYILHGTITKFYCDLSGSPSPEVNVAICFTILDFPADRQVVFEKCFTVRQPVERPSRPDDLVPAYEKCLEHIFSLFETSLSRSFHESDGH